MSIQAVAWVLQHSRTSANDRCVLIALANRFDPKEPWRCWPGIETIAAEANVSESTVKRCLASCVALGELLIYYNQGANSDRPDRRTNLYVIPDLTDWRPAGGQPDTPCQRGVKSDGTGGQIRWNGGSTVTPYPSVDPTVDSTYISTRTHVFLPGSGFLKQADEEAPEPLPPSDAIATIRRLRKREG